MRTEQFQVSPRVVLPLPMLVIRLLIFLVRPVRFPVRLSTPFLNHQNSTVSVVLSWSPGVALQYKVELEFGRTGVIVGPVILGAVFRIVVELVVLPE